MSDDAALTPIKPTRSPASGNTLWRIVKYTTGKAVMLFITVVIGLYLTILIVNLGGYVDDIFRANIDENIGTMILGGWLKDVEDETERLQTIEETRWAMQEAMGLHQPFLLRSGRWLLHSLTLELGPVYSRFVQTFYVGEVQPIIMARLPYTLVLAGSANLATFVFSISLALFLARKPGSFYDRLTTVLSAFTSAPSWIIGLILVFFFTISNQILPTPREINLNPVEHSLTYYLSILQQMILPIFAVILSSLFQSAYAWRTFFLIYSHEDYVELARAKGLTPRQIEARYIIRPTMPYILTNFAMLMIGFWQSTLALETVFRWPGIGTLFLSAVLSIQTTLLLGIVVIFAYLLAITVFVLDILYAWIDPRVRLGNQNSTNRARLAKRKRGPQTALLQPALTFNQTSRQALLTNDQPRPSLRQTWLNLWRQIHARFQQFNRSGWQEIRRYPSALVGIMIILIMAGLAIYTVIAYPYPQAVKSWRYHSESDFRSAWYRNPVSALPAWVNYFRGERLPPNIILHSGNLQDIETRAISEGISQTIYPLTFEYPYASFPQDITIYLKSRFDQKQPFATFSWIKPDGERIELGGFGLKTYDTFYVSRDERLQAKLKTRSMHEMLFGNPQTSPIEPLKGTYTLEISVVAFEPDSQAEIEMVIYGRVFGIAGTDDQRRDLKIPILWGIPVALAFGLLGALGTSLAAMLIAAVGVWRSGWVDALIQRLTELNMIIPSLPIAILVFMFYSKSVWALLGVVVLLNIFGSAIKNYRAIFLQIREAPYIEGALAYGVSNWRIIWRYLLPPILPIMIPQLVIMAPTYVFYEATLAFLGISDPDLPTWGKIINEALSASNLQSNAYWLLEPVTLLVITSLAFALLGFALDRILNPKMRQM